MRRNHRRGFRVLGIAVAIAALLGTWSATAARPASTPYSEPSKGQPCEYSAHDKPDRQRKSLCTRAFLRLTADLAARPNKLFGNCANVRTAPIPCGWRVTLGPTQV